MIKLKEFFDNREELAIGAIFGLSVVMFIGLWVFITMPMCALLWRLGGVTGGDEWFRRMGVPSVIVLSVFIASHQWISLLPIILFWLPLTMGYGIPDATDEGSKLGAFWYKVTKQNRVLSDILTRLTIALACTISLIPLFFISPLAAFVACLIIVVGFPSATVLI